MVLTWPMVDKANSSFYYFCDIRLDVIQNKLQEKTSEELTKWALNIIHYLF